MVHHFDSSPWGCVLYPPCPYPRCRPELIAETLVRIELPLPLAPQAVGNQAREFAHVEARAGRVCVRS